MLAVVFIAVGNSLKPIEITTETAQVASIKTEQ